MRWFALLVEGDAASDWPVGSDLEGVAEWAGNVEDNVGDLRLNKQSVIFVGNLLIQLLNES